MRNDYHDFYIYKNFDNIKKEYNPVRNLNQINDLNGVDLALKTNRVNTILLDISKIVVPETLRNLFHSPSFYFIIERELNELIIYLNENYFKGLYYEVLCFIILNTHKHYIAYLDENSSFGLENDFKTLEKEKNNLIKVLDLFIKRYKIPEANVPPLQSIKFSFLKGGKLKSYKIENYILIDDIISTYLNKYEFSHSNPEKWKEETDKYLIGFDVEKFERIFKIKMAKEIYQFIISENIVKAKENQVLNSALRLTNIIFSLASIPVNKTSILYNKNIPLKNYHSLKQIDVLGNWITRY